VTARPGHTAEEIEKAIDEELAAFRKDVLHPQLERAQNGFETHTIQGLQRSEGFGGIADRLNDTSLPRHTGLSRAGSCAAPEDATVASIRAFAREQLKPNARVVVYESPANRTGAGRSHSKNAAEGKKHRRGSRLAEAAWRTNAPQAAGASATQFARAEIFKLENGLTVVYNYRPGLPVVAAHFGLQHGERRQSCR